MCDSLIKHVQFLTTSQIIIIIIKRVRFGFWVLWVMRPTTLPVPPIYFGSSHKFDPRTCVLSTQYNTHKFDIGTCGLSTRYTFLCHFIFIPNLINLILGHVDYRSTTLSCTTVIHSFH